VHEQGPAKLRRAVLQAGQTDHAPSRPTVVATLATTWTQLIQKQPEPARVSDGWANASPRAPRDDAPGRRQQRGQAPPLA